MTKFFRVMLLLMVWITIFSITPFTISNLFEFFDTKFLVLPFIAFFSLLLIVKGKLRDTEKSILGLVFFQVLNLMLIGIFSEWPEYEIRYFFICTHLVSSLIILMLVINFLKLETFLFSFFIVLTVMGISGIFIWASGLLFGLEPYSTFINPDGRVAYNFIFAFTNDYLKVGEVSILRPAGYFDEPGKNLSFKISEGKGLRGCHVAQSLRQRVCCCYCAVDLN